MSTDGATGATDLLTVRTVPPALAGERVDRAASVLFPDYSRTLLTRALTAGQLTVDGQVLRPRQRLKGGETLTLSGELRAETLPDTPQAIPLSILYEDDDLLVLDKPAGLVVHPGAGNPDRTLVNALLAYRPALATLPRAGVVHRLDKETSGVMMVAASTAAHTRLVAMLAAREINRAYVAVVEGRLVSGADYRQPIGRDPHHRTRQAVREDGRAAHTSVRVLERFRVHTSVQATLHTGRTHQIRVHLGHAGYPLVGDATYGARGRLPPAPSSELIRTIRGFRRQALHAEHLALDHPRTGEPLQFTAPRPLDIELLLQRLREDVRASESDDV
ncbi:MAG: RluA family pseudouridine synthase [Pseudomonadales bacterium]|nr:RluA family pseudouridine synthase [Pseudomonadales bacterium]MCP5185202.1 RluA family pseudouridine synthase [Pseudomonadales bacterium]